MFDAQTAFAHQIADASGELILKYFRRPTDVSDKADTSPVTEADKSSERLMRNMIERYFPNDGIIGEEYGKENENAEFVWVLDPIDGTKSFIAGVPLFGTLIALLHNGVPVMGLINQPYTKERWVGVVGKRTTLNGAVVHTRRCADVRQAVLFSTADKQMFADADDKRRFAVLYDRVKTARFSTDCYGYGLLSAGCGDIVCEADMKLYDYAALVPIVAGAGGVMTDWDGNDLSENKGGGRILAVGDPQLLPDVLEVLNQ